MSFYYLLIDCSRECGDIAPFIRMVKYFIIPFIQIIIPSILILYGTFDFLKAVVASKEDIMKNSFSMFVKRIIYAVLVFLIFSIVILVFNIAEKSGVAKSTSWFSCWIAVKNDNSDDCVFKDYSSGSAGALGDVDKNFNENDNHGLGNVSGTSDKNPIVQNGSSFGNSSGSTVSYSDWKIIINPSHQFNNLTCGKIKNYSNESESMYYLANVVKGKLESNGFSVYITNKDPNNDHLATKQIKEGISNLNSNGKNIYIALHSNANTNNGALCANSSLFGPKTYYAYNLHTTVKDSSTKKNDSANLADKLERSLISYWRSNGMKVSMYCGDGDNDNCGDHDDSTKSCVYDSCNGLYNLNKFDKSVDAVSCEESCSFVREPRLYYLYGGTGAASLIEIGYHDNKIDQNFITTHTDGLADSVVTGIKNYISTK